MRPLWMEFSEDEETWAMDDQFMLGMYVCTCVKDGLCSTCLVCTYVKGGFFQYMLGMYVSM